MPAKKSTAPLSAAQQRRKAILAAHTAYVKEAVEKLEAGQTLAWEEMESAKLLLAANAETPRLFESDKKELLQSESVAKRILKRLPPERVEEIAATMTAYINTGINSVEEGRFGYIASRETEGAVKGHYDALKELCGGEGTLFNYMYRRVQYHIGKQTQITSEKSLMDAEGWFSNLDRRGKFERG